MLRKHPEQLGQPLFSFWGELIEQGFPAMVDEVMIHGRSVTVENAYYEVRRAPYSTKASPDLRSQHTHENDGLRAQEGYYNFTLLPILDATGGVAGVLYEGVETTPNVIGERRLSTILRIDDRSSDVTTLKEIWKAVLDGLNHNVQDVPFAFLYSSTDGPPKNDSVADRFSLEGSIGLSSDHPLGRLSAQNTSLTAFIEQVLTSGDSMMVNCSDLKWRSEGSINPHQVHQLDLNSSPKDMDSASSGSNESFSLHHQPFIIPGRGFDHQVDSALILPIPRLGGSEPSGILVLGMNPQRPYDDSYQQWVRQLTESLVRIVASISIPEESRRHQSATQQMAREHARITSILTGRKREEELAATTLKRIADMAPVGMAMFGPDGRQIWVVGLAISNLKPLFVRFGVLTHCRRIKDMQTISEFQEMTLI